MLFTSLSVKQLDFSSDVRFARNVRRLRPEVFRGLQSQRTRFPNAGHRCDFTNITYMKQLLLVIIVQYYIHTSHETFNVHAFDHFSTLYISYSQSTYKICCTFHRARAVRCNDSQVTPLLVIRQN